MCIYSGPRPASSTITSPVEPAGRSTMGTPKIRHDPLCRPATCSQLCGQPGKWSCGVGCGARTEPNGACCACGGCTAGPCSHGTNLQQDPTASYTMLHLSHAKARQHGLDVNTSVPAKHAVCGIDSHLSGGLGKRIQGASSFERLGVIAEVHFEKHRPIVLSAADKFALHPQLRKWPFASASRRTDHTSLVTARMASMGAELRKRGRDDFRVEKDKCEMYRFFGRAKLPTARVLGVWTSLPAFLRDLQSGSAFSSVTSWPIFLKTCHLTQGSAGSVRPLPSAAWVQGNWEELVNWLWRKWTQRGDDIGRLWTAESNALTDALSPGFMLQDYTPSRFPLFSPLPPPAPAVCIFPLLSLLHLQESVELFSARAADGRLHTQPLELKVAVYMPSPLVILPHIHIHTHPLSLTLASLSPQHR